MGQRANYIIKSSPGYELFYSHWGANVIDRDLFWGPNLSEAFLRSQRPMGEWLDEVWCEGGAVLDPGSRSLLLFGGEDVLLDIHLRTVYWRLLGCAWGGWALSWADRGILDLAEAVGVSREVVLTPRCRQGPEVEPCNLRLADDQKHWCTTLVSLAGERHLGFDNELEELLLMGPELLRQLPQRDPKLVTREEPATGGAVIDPGARSLNFWCLNGPPLIEEWVRQRWNGWRVERRQDRAWSQVKRLERLSGRPPRIEEDYLERLVRMLGQLIGDRSASLDFLTQRLQELKGQGSEVEVNPLALEDVRPTVSGEAREAILARALRDYRNHPLGPLDWS